MQGIEGYAVEISFMVQTLWADGALFLCCTVMFHGPAKTLCCINTFIMIESRPIITVFISCSVRLLKHWLQIVLFALWFADDKNSLI